MIRVNRLAVANWTAISLLISLLIHGASAVQAEQTAGAQTTAKTIKEKAATPPTANGAHRTDNEIPVPSCDQIDYSHPDAYLSLSAHIGNKNHILEIAATISGKTPEDKLISIGRWIHSRLVYKADAPDEWRDFDRLVRDGNYGGCADYSVVFGALARACGIPTVWVKTLDADWIREFRIRGTEGTWSGHVFLEIFLRNHWVLLDDTELVLYEEYDPKMRILPGNRYAYAKGGDPFDLILSSRWELCKAQIRATFRDFDLSKLPVGTGRALATGVKVAASGATPPPKYPAMFVFYSENMEPSARILADILVPKLTHHFTGRPHSLKDYQEQFTRWAKPGDTIVLLLLASQKDRVPAAFQDLLPKSWSKLEAEAVRNGAVIYNGESRKMHIVLLVAKGPAELTTLIRTTQW
jgi:transglutaminase-like putative cysteine protease